MILIEENFTDILTEASGDGKKTYLTGCFMEWGIQNQNGRTYSEADMKATVKKINDAAAAGRHILNELDHPKSLEVKLANVSHRLMEARMNGKQVWVKAEVLDKHPSGAILKSLIDSGVGVGVSSRGSGSLNESTGMVSNFNFVCCDAVATPSCRSAYPETLQEQLEWSKRGNIITDLAENAYHDPIAQKFFEIEMKKFIDNLYK